MGYLLRIVRVGLIVTAGAAGFMPFDIASAQVGERGPIGLMGHAPTNSRRPLHTPLEHESASLDAPHGETCVPREQCCKVCSKGKACGNTCIRRAYECHQGRGCACNEAEVCE
jgi:hypothetical protein